MFYKIKASILIGQYTTFEQTALKNYTGNSRKK